ATVPEFPSPTSFAAAAAATPRAGAVLVRPERARGGGRELVSLAAGARGRPSLVLIAAGCGFSKHTSVCS
ncbi:unnamed protein product, partial [Urochloa humidicola]